MSKQIEINKEKFFVKIEEYNNVQKIFSNLRIYENLGLHERLCSLFEKLTGCFICDELDQLEQIKQAENINFIIYNCDHGGYIPIKLKNSFDKIFIQSTNQEHLDNIYKNIDYHKTTNIYTTKPPIDILKEKNILFICEQTEQNNQNNLLLDLDEYLKSNKNMIISNRLDLLDKNFKYKYHITDTNYFLYLNRNDNFILTFKYYINFDTNVLFYDNLINLCLMVKNGGEQFENFLKSNIHLIDKWTILDTGSTDNTVEIINKILVDKKEGNLYQEPFINFKDSRNRLLELAGESCKFIVMIDDTYYIKGSLRNFLNYVRGDQYSSSFSIYIHDDDIKYSSNRILKSAKKLRYVYRIHEVISEKDNIIVNIPHEITHIFDEKSEQMQKRTSQRLDLDLKFLYEELEENPHDPRTYFYLGQTYNLLGDYENSYKYFMKRYEFMNSGFLQERFSAILRAARIANHNLQYSWEHCEDLYMKAYQIDDSRPEPFYFIGLHYYLIKDYKKSFYYLKKAFKLGIPEDSQFDIILNIYYHCIPKFLGKICYDLDEYDIGEKATELFLNYPNNKKTEDYSEMLSWNLIYKKLNIYKGNKQIKLFHSKPIFCFVADGGFKQWSGSDILTNGVGGSETYIIEMAKHIQKIGLFQTYVFSNTPGGQEEIFEGTIYKPLSSYYEFINTTHVHHCIISRFSEYLPVTFKGWTENVYLVIHDLTPSGSVIPMDYKLKKIFCLTEWHVEYFTSLYPQLKNITVEFYYGCAFDYSSKSNNSNSDNSNSDNSKSNNKIPYSFIYSSFPNRGLLELLEMWSQIYKLEPRATLNIFSDVDNKWSNDVEPEKMQKIRKLLDQYKLEPNGLGIRYHGWVKKDILKQYWETSDIWFYPCTFMETFCLTALESACSKTLVISNDLGALSNTVGDRGVIIKGDATNEKWKIEALDKIKYFLDEKNLDEKNQLIEKNYTWSKNLTWANQASLLITKYILKNNLEHLNSFDLIPTNFEFEVANKAINYFISSNPKIKNGQEVKILDIYGWTGLNSIHFIKNIPNSIGICINEWDNWNNKITPNNNFNYLEKSFKLNMINSDSSDKITGINSNQILKLIEFVKTNKKFDFIYIGTNYNPTQLYTLITLGWELLDSFGIIGISYNDKLEKVLNQFIFDFKPNYKLISSEHKVWIEKII